MRIDDFNYFGKEKVGANSNQSINKVTQKDFDLDLQKVSETAQGSDYEVQGSGHFWCHISEHNCEISIFNCAKG